MIRPFAVAVLLGCVGPSVALAYSADVYAVCKLDPNGDNFLALREGPSSRSRMLMKLPPGTRVEDWGRSGNWMQVDVQIATRPRGFVYTGYLCLVEDH